jgi:hypothetical protein
LITYTNLPNAFGDHLEQSEGDKFEDYRNWYENKDRYNNNNEYY